MNPQHMNQNPVSNSAPDDLDRLIAAHFRAGDDLAPSSGFTLSVIHELQAQTAAPPPLPFPWRRVLPGLIALVCILASFCIFVLRRLPKFLDGQEPAQTSSTVFGSLAPFHLSTVEQGLCWAAASACLAIAAAAVSIRFAGTRKRMRV